VLSLFKAYLFWITNSDPRSNVKYHLPAAFFLVTSLTPEKMYRSFVKSTKCQFIATLQPAAVRFLTHSAPQSFKWEDPLGAESLLTEEELAISETAESYCQERMLPRVLRMWMVCIP
jgi:hypothetical protein